MLLPSPGAGFDPRAQSEAHQILMQADQQNLNRGRPAELGQLTLSGHLLFAGDGSYSIGQLTGNRPQWVYTTAGLRVGAAMEVGANYLEMGNESVAAPAYIDFRTGGVAADFEARILRNSGVNSTLEVSQSGTGAIVWTMAGSEAMRLTGAGAGRQLRVSCNIDFGTGGVYDIGTSGNYPRNLTADGTVAGATVSVRNVTTTLAALQYAFAGSQHHLIVGGDALNQNIVFDILGTEVARFNAAGNFVLATGKTIIIGAAQVVGPRGLTYGAPTGTATRTTFATSTVTLPLLAERVKALIDDLRTHGLIG